MPSRKDRKKSARTPGWMRKFASRVLLKIAYLSLPVMVLGVGILLFPLTWLPLPTPHMASDTTIYAQGGQLIDVLYSRQNRMPIPYSAIPKTMQNALVSIEDDTFWIEPALDPVGIFRAALTDITHHQILQGGSTLTQQLAKNLYLSDRRTFRRKIAEFFISMKLATTYTRPQIIDLYLNDVYFGEGAYGIEAASQTYFGHSAKALTLPESALLAGVVNAPSYFDPYLHPEAAIARRNQVLTRMQQLGYITAFAAARAKRTPLYLSGGMALANRAPYFTQLVEDDLTQLDPSLAKDLGSGGYRITTTLNWPMQQAADRTVATYLPATSLVHGVPEPETGLVAIDPQNGYVRALVGGDNYARTQFNRALDARRQPGSTMKYYLYTTVINDGYPTSSTQVSAPVRFPNGNGTYYVPHNYGYVYNGRLVIRRAIALSDNICAVKWMNTVGPKAMIATADAMGITTPLADNLTTALGSSAVTPMEMARGVSTLANGGKRVRPMAVLKVIAPSGRVVFTDTPHLTPVLTPQVAYVVTQLFHAPLLNPHGTAHDLEPIINRPAAAKTGTSNLQRDAWLVGYTPQLATAVWVGNDNYAPLGLTGDRGAGPIWAHFMAAALANRPKRTFPAPAGLIWKSVCIGDGLLPNGCCSTYREVFLPGRVPVSISPGCGSGGTFSSTGGVTPVPVPSPDKSLGNILQGLIRSLAP